LFPVLSIAEDGNFTGGIEVEGWYAWWVPFTSRNEEKGVLTRYQIDPAFLYGTTVSMRSEGKSYFALQYLTSRLEGEIKSKAVTERRDRAVFDEFVKWRGDIIHRMSGDRYLYTKLTYGGFRGKAQFTDKTSFAVPQELDVNSQFAVADLMWMKYTEGKYLAGFGLRLMSYKIPAVTYVTSGAVITKINFSDTEFRSYSLAISLLDGSRVSRDGQSPEVPFLSGSYSVMGRTGNFTFYLDDFILYLGYAESDSSVMGKGKGLTVGIEGSSGVKKEWRFKESRLSLKLGIRFLYNLLSTYKGDEDNQEETTTEDVFIGPFLNLTWVF
jgi:hypothetical protein